MATTSTVTSGYRHEAFFWDDEDAFLAGMVPFVRDGVEAGDPVMVAVPSPRLDRLRSELGPHAQEVRFVDMGELGRNPARIIPAWKSFVDECAVGGQQVRGIGEPIWAGRRPVEVSECLLHESLLNIAVAPETPLWLVCPYDTARLDGDVLAEARLTHPETAAVMPPGRDLADRADDAFFVDLPPASGPSFERSFTAADLRLVHDEVLQQAVASGVQAERAVDLALAVHEVAANSVLHALGDGVLQIWREPMALVCEVRDLGQITDPMIGRRSPSIQSQHGRGLWMVNQLCDLVQIRSHPGGTTVRLHTWL